MPLLVYSAADYLGQFQRLLPRGRIWHRGASRVQDAVLATLMPTWARLHLRLNDLIAQIFPCSTTELLTEWEATLGLPDPCIGPLDSLQARVAAVCAKFAARGGQSKTYYIEVAHALGFEIEIEEYATFVAGSATGGLLSGLDWAYAWRIIVAETMVRAFSAGISNAGEPLREWGNRTLECVMEALKPAHTILVFTYLSGGASTWDAGQSRWDFGLSNWDQFNA